MWRRREFPPRRAIRHPPQGILVAAAGAKLQHDRAELLGQPWVRIRHFHADPGERRFQAEPRLDADQHQVEGIGKSVDDLALPAVGLRGEEDRLGDKGPPAPRSTTTA